MLLRDYEYVRNAIFFLDEGYRRLLPDFRQIATDTRLVPQAALVDEGSVEVYANEFGTGESTTDESRFGIARFDVNGPRDNRPGYVEWGLWRQLDRSEFSVVPEHGYIIIDRSVPDHHALGVRYRTADGTQFGAATDTLRLKLIKSRGALPRFPTWDLMWKNAYWVGLALPSGQKLEASDLTVQVLWRDEEGALQTTQEGVPIVQILGIDKHGVARSSPPDGIMDTDYIGLDVERGLLVFPDQTPFAPRHPPLQSLTVTVPGVYGRPDRPTLDAITRYQVLVEIAPR